MQITLPLCVAFLLVVTVGCGLDSRGHESIDPDGGVALSNDASEGTDGALAGDTYEGDASQPPIDSAPSDSACNTAGCPCSGTDASSCYDSQEVCLAGTCTACGAQGTNSLSCRNGKTCSDGDCGG